MPSCTIKAVLFLLTMVVLVSVACRLPDSGISTPTGVPATPELAVTGDPTPVPTHPANVPTLTPRPTPPPPVTAHRIAIHRIYGVAEFYDRTTSQAFIPRGANYFLLMPVEDHYENRLLAAGIYDHQRTQADLAALSAAGFNTIRVVIDDCTTGDNCIGIPDGPGLNPTYLDNLADLINLAKANNLYVLIASQGLPTSGGYAALAAKGSNSSFGAGINTQVLTRDGIHASQQYWSDLLLGLATRQAAFEAILGWELIGEQFYQNDQPPFSLQAARVTLANNKSYDMSRPSQREALAVDGLRFYIDGVKQTILKYDPTALVTMGFLAPDSPNTWREGDNRYVVTSPLLGASPLDFFDLHASPGNTLTMTQLIQNYGLGGHVSVPVIMGEVGASTWAFPQISQAAIAIQDWIAASCAEGFSGWLYMGYNATPAGLTNATWGLVDEHETLLKALSPRNQPDACSTTTLPGRNLALHKPVQVSASLPDQTPEMAVDGDPSTQWSAGGFPTQWIEIDLGGLFSIGEIRLTVGQWPDGNTNHQLWVGSNPNNMRQIHVFSGYEADYDILSYIPDSLLQNIRYVRIITTESPSWVSWREIEVLSAFPATPTPNPQQKLTPSPSP